jgi:N-acetylglutamate synthase
MVATLQHLGSALPCGWTRWRDGVLASVTGAEESVLNVVLVASEEVDDTPIGELLDEVSATGLPHCLQAPPCDVERVGRIALARAMTLEEPIPLMVLDDLSALDRDAQLADGLVLRELAPEEAALHPEVASRGFEAPIEPMIHVTRASVLAADGVRCYVGEVDGRPVCTGLGVTVGSQVGLLTIATLPAYRRRGYGAALTARALIDGYADGASWAWLQSSDAGVAIYERLGFLTVERSANWHSAGIA